MRIGRGVAINEREVVRSLLARGFYGASGARPSTRSAETRSAVNTPRPLTRAEMKMLSLDELLEYAARMREEGVIE
jgi:hypothetical protein